MILGWLTNTAKIVGDVIDAVGSNPLPPGEAAQTLVAKFTVGNLRSLVTVAKGLPLSQIETLLEGKGSVDDAIDVTEEMVALIAAAFPGAIPEAALIEMGLEVAKTVYDVARTSGIHIEPGTPPWYQPGPSPWRGR